MNRTPDQSDGSPGVMVTYTPSGEACFKLALALMSISSGSDCRASYNSSSRFCFASDGMLDVII
jgi:hypothetical protein